MDKLAEKGEAVVAAIENCRSRFFPRAVEYERMTAALIAFREYVEEVTRTSLKRETKCICEKSRIPSSKYRNGGSLR